jgi:hypothetical protein
MSNELMTVKLWDELDESHSESLNGGYGYGYGYGGYNYTSSSIYISGGVGSLQQNGGDGTQINVNSVGKAPQYRPYYYY